MNQIRLLHLCQSATTSKRGKPGGGHKRSKKAFTIIPDLGNRQNFTH